MRARACDALSFVDMCLGLVRPRPSVGADRASDSACQLVLYFLVVYWLLISILPELAIYANFVTVHKTVDKCNI